MKNYKFYSVLVALLAIGAVLTGCTKTPEQIYNDQASGVALVLTQYYYSVELDDGTTIYFSGVDDEGDMTDLAFDPDSITPSAAFGTAFFIDNNGTLLTNRHVANPVVDKDDVKKCINNLISGLTALVRYYQDQMAAEYAKIDSRISQNQGYQYNPYTGDYDAVELAVNDELREQQQALEEMYTEAENSVRQLRSINVNDIKIRTHSQIGIAYHDTYVTNPNDFKPCVVLKTSQDENVDLALICLKDKKTPNGAFVFQMADEKPLKLNDQLSMIGYNHGIELAATREGIKAQLTTGNVSQKPDGERVMYTISAMQGSSGSPVLNEYGEVVAVNFAKIRDTDNFNFGIPLNRIKQFLNR